MKKLFIIAAAAVVAAGCANKNAYTVSGTMTEENDGRYVYLYKYPGQPAECLVDSAKVRHGKFRFRGEADTCEACYVSNLGSEEVFAVGNHDDTSFIVMFFAEPGDIVLDIDNSSASGTPSNDAYAEYMRRRNELQQQYYDSATQQKRDDLIAQSDSLTVRTFEANADNIFGATLLQQLSYEMTGTETMNAIMDFPVSVQGSRVLAELREEAEAKMPTDPGQPYIEVVQHDMDGRELSLSSVVENPRNKYVLVDFWASWCGPCMGEVPYLTAVYDKYRRKGFEIYGISLDTNAESWKNCVKSRKMNWLHVSDLNRFDNKAARDYGVRGIPSNFLVDTSTGEIVAVNLRGEALAAKMAELLD